MNAAPVRSNASRGRRRAVLLGTAAALVAFALALFSPPLRAQEAAVDAERSFLQVNEAEARRLRTVAEEPTPANLTGGALFAHFARKNDAATRLGDPVLRARLLREAMAAMPSDPFWPNALASVVRSDEGKHAEGRQLMDKAVELTPPGPRRIFFSASRAQMMVSDRVAGAAEALAQTQKEAEELLATLKPSNERVQVLRALATLARARGMQALQMAQMQTALAADLEAIGLLREALAGVVALGSQSRSLAVTATDLASAQKGRASRLGALGRFAEAEAAIAEHLEFIGKYQLPLPFAAGAHHELAYMQIMRGDPARAEQQLRLALEVLDKLNFPSNNPSRLSKHRDIAITLWARGRYAEARREFDHLDRANRVNPESRPRYYSSERALVYLTGGWPDQAAALFEQMAKEWRERLGPGHYNTARAEGLRGAALWRSTDGARREQGAELLRQAVVTILSPRNVDFLDDIGLRRRERTLIFDAYLEASAERGAMQALAALGVADRLIGGGTGQAVADAALRAAAGDPALAGLVRDEQDARTRLRALQQRALGDGANEADQHKQIAELEAQRQQLRDRIRLGYPGYDRLVQPPLPNASEVAQRLGRDEVLLLALPTDRWLYLWALTADELPQFVRVDANAETIAALVLRLRAGLDFGGSRAPRFDPAAAHELYRHLLAPVAARLNGRKHLIVATTGPLATVPLPVLLTAPPAGSGPQPWLARQLAVSTVPNVASWLALRQLPPAQAAPDPLLAWADPQYAAVARGAAPEGRAPARAAGTLRYELLPRLPETREEAAAIAAALKARPDSDIIVGDRATRSSVLESNRNGQLGRKRVLLFATHGLVAGDLPGLEQPALALAAEPGKPELTALLGLDDILGLKLNADWVVLSACNTAAGDGKAEEALSGLARGFLYAGSRSLLVTHWAVESESAKLLTTATFEHHAADPRATKAESLRQAMLKVMAMPKYAHPAYWAPFALVGDGAR